GTQADPRDAISGVIKGGAPDLRAGAAAEPGRGRAIESKALCGRSGVVQPYTGLRSDQNLAIVLHGQRESVPPRTKRRVQNSVLVEPGNIAPRLPAERIERTANENLSVRLHRKGLHGPVRPRIKR